MGKIFGKLSKIDRYFVGKTHPNIFLKNSEHRIAIDLDNIHCRQTHWIKDKLDRHLCLNCLQKSNCPGCLSGERVIPRFITYGCELNEEDVVCNPGILDINQTLLSGLLRTASTLEEKHFFKLVKSESRLPIYSIRPYRKITRKEEDLINELFSKCSNLYNIELMCKPIKLEEWEARIRGEVYSSIEIKKIGRAKAVAGGLK